MIDCLPTQALAFLAVFVYATHARQAIAFEWKPGFRLNVRKDHFSQRVIDVWSSQHVDVDVYHFVQKQAACTFTEYVDI